MTEGIFICPKCGRKREGLSRDGIHAEAVCADCQEERKLDIAYRSALSPSAEDLGLVGSRGATVYVRGGGCGRRIVRKSEPMAG